MSSPPPPLRIPALVLLVLLALLVVPAGGFADDAAEDPDAEAEAKAVYERYLEQRRGKTWGSFIRRLDALRDLAPIPAASARKNLLRVAKSGRSRDDKALAVAGLAEYGDAASAEALASLLGRRSDATFLRLLGDGWGRAKRGDTLAWLGEDALGHAMPGIVRAALIAQWEQAMPETREAILALYEANVERDVHRAYEAVRALGRIGDAEVKDTLLDAAARDDVRLRLAAVDVLPRQDLEDAHIREAIRERLRDEAPVVRRALAVAAGDAEAKALVPDIALLLQDPDLCVRKEAHDQLHKIAGVDLGYDPAAWRRWAEEGSGGKPLPRGTHTVAKYHGLEVWSSRVLFIVDRSGSMGWPHAPQATCRLTVARDELKLVLRQLSKDTLFNVIVFSDKVKTWRQGEVEADPKTVKRALKWIDKQLEEPDGGTNTHDVLRRALAENPQVDTIYLLSDGLPEDGDVATSEAILADLAEWNRYRRVKIHTIALTLEGLDRGRYVVRSWSLKRLKTFMQRLAAHTGGTYTLVVRPPAR